MQVWQQIVIVVVAFGSITWMSLAIVGLLSRSARDTATVRDATRVESALVGGVVPEGARVFDGWSYRVGARFAGRVRVAVYDDHVAVAGPRVPRVLYELWIWAQGLLLVLVVPALAAAIVTVDWRWALVALALFAVSFAISMGGAGLWPGLGELGASTDGGFFKALEFPRALVSDVRIGKGWSAGGLGIVLLPYKAGIDAMAGVRAVSFFGPDEHGHEVRFAVHMHSDEDARQLSDLLARG